MEKRGRRERRREIRKEARSESQKREEMGRNRMNPRARAPSGYTSQSLNCDRRYPLHASRNSLLARVDEWDARPAVLQQPLSAGLHADTWTAMFSTYSGVDVTAAAAALEGLRVIFNCL